MNHHLDTSKLGQGAMSKQSGCWNFENHRVEKDVSTELENIEIT